MGGDLIFGSAVMVACLFVQCLFVALLIGILLRMERRGFIKPSPLRTAATLTLFTLIMVAGTLGQIGVWASVFLVRGEFSDFATAFYHSTVNFATLGYGDIVMSEQERLLGALEAVNGVMMFGLTTGVLFSVMNALLQRGWDARMG
jgi:hypothetical protein